jgi:apolipoprotein N-acyltransferase
LTGVLLTLSFPKFGHPAIGWVALLPLLIAIANSTALSFDHPRPRSFRIFLLGEITGLVYFWGTLYWLVDTMVTFGGMPRVLAAGAAGLLIAYLALFPACFALLLAFALRRLGPRALLLAPAIWVATELGRTYILTGFPWVLLGYAESSLLPLAQMVSVVGIYGLSALVAGPSAVTAFVFFGRGNRERLVAIGVLIAVMTATIAWGSARVQESALLQHGDPVRIGVVQGNVPQTEKWNESSADKIFSRYLAMSRQAAAQGAHLLIWPEASLPYFYERQPHVANAIGVVARETNSYLLFGGDQMEEVGGTRRFFNSSFLITPEGRVAGTYRKMHLVPFGEYVPFEKWLYFVTPIVKSDFAAGDGVNVMPAGSHPVSTMICYEAIFPDLALDAVRQGSQLLMTITNDAWYELSSAPHQHFEMARVRAIEQGRYLVRAANTGISGIVDPYGRVLERTNLFEPAVLTADVRFLTDRTVYSRIGNLFAYACVLLTALPVLVRRGRLF